MDRKLKGLGYCYKEALKIIQKEYPDADMDIFTGDYIFGYWGDDEMYIDQKASYEYPGMYYPGPAAATDEFMIKVLVAEGMHTIQKQEESREKIGIEDTVLYHSENRGMDVLRKHMQEDYIRNAAEALLKCEKKTVLLTTGFYVKGYAETDGPAGTWAIAKALEQIGYHPVIVTDELCRGIFEQENLQVEYYPLYPEQDTAEKLLHKHQPCAMIALERCGMNRNHDYANMRGISIREHTAPVDELFIAADQDILTIGIGDGGNEIGMGNVQDVIAEQLTLVPCVTCTDHLIIATVSNWGGYGLCAYLQKMTGIEVLPSADEVIAFMERAAQYGCVDGISGEHVIKEDGYEPEVTRSILQKLKNCIEA